MKLTVQGQMSFLMPKLSLSLYLSLSISLSLSPLQQPFYRWTWVSQYYYASTVDFIGAKGDGGGGDNWSYKTCNTPVKSPPTNQHSPFYGPNALHVAQPTVSKHWRDRRRQQTNSTILNRTNAVIQSKNLLWNSHLPTCRQHRWCHGGQTRDRQCTGWPRGCCSLGSADPRLLEPNRVTAQQTELDSCWLCQLTRLHTPCWYRRQMPLYCTTTTDTRQKLLISTNPVGPFLGITLCRNVYQNEDILYITYSNLAALLICWNHTGCRWTSSWSQRNRPTCSQRLMTCSTHIITK